MPDDPSGLTTGRAVDGNKAWSAGAGAGVLAAGLTERPPGSCARSVGAWKIRARRCPRRIGAEEGPPEVVPRRETDARMSRMRALTEWSCQMDIETPSGKGGRCRNAEAADGLDDGVRRSRWAGWMVVRKGRAFRAPGTGLVRLWIRRLAFYTRGRAFLYLLGPAGCCRLRGFGICGEVGLTGPRGALGQRRKRGVQRSSRSASSSSSSSWNVSSRSDSTVNSVSVLP